MQCSARPGIDADDGCDPKKTRSVRARCSTPLAFLWIVSKFGVEEANDVLGTEDLVISVLKGSVNPTEFELYYREQATARPITYELAIHKDNSGSPYLSRERLRQRRRAPRRARPFSFLIMSEGKGCAYKRTAQAHQVPYLPHLPHVLAHLPPKRESDLAADHIARWLPRSFASHSGWDEPPILQFSRRVPSHSSKRRTALVMGPQRASDGELAQTQAAPYAQACCEHNATFAPALLPHVACLGGRDAMLLGPLPNQEGRISTPRLLFRWVVSNTGDNAL